MGILARLLGAVPKEEQFGIRLQEKQPWRVGPTEDFERFFRALPVLGVADGIAYFEETGEQHVAEFLRAQSVEPRVRVAVGTIWPRPDTYHLPLTANHMEDLAAFLERRPAGYLCAHCHVYRGKTVLLEWHDAFGSDPMYLSRTIVEDAIARFAQGVGTRYACGWL